MTYQTPIISRPSGQWEVVIGLEVHAQITSASKLFSGAATAYGAAPNTQVSLIDAAFPGMLPVINEMCVRQAIKTGLALNAQIAAWSQFDRKNYFYADLPSGYQISQHLHPVVGEGFMDITLEDQTTKRIAIERLHLEQDAGKSIHDQHPSESYIDLNRAGVGLMEIVTKPDLRSAEEVVAFMRKLRCVLRYLGTCDGNMEQGSMRADVNVSLRRVGEPLGTRAEMKNINSIRFMQQAIQYEVARQLDLLENGQEVMQETRLFDHQKGETRSMRSKENAHDYRYFPDPDLPPLRISEELIAQVKATLPELPDEKAQRFMADYGLTVYDAGVLVAEQEEAAYFESAVAASQAVAKDPKIAKILANWMMGELFAALNRDSLKIDQSRISAIQLAGLIDAIADDTISGKIAKEVFGHMWDSGDDAAHIIQAQGLQQVSDTGAIDAIIQGVLDAHSDKVADYRSGKDKLFGFFVGQVMKAMAGKGNPQLVNDRLLEKLNQA